MRYLFPKSQPLAGLDYGAARVLSRAFRDRSKRATTSRRSAVREVYREFWEHVLPAIASGRLFAYALDVNSDGRHDVDRRLRNLLKHEPFRHMLALKFVHDHEGKRRHLHVILLSRVWWSSKKLAALARKHVVTTTTRDGRRFTPVRVRWLYRKDYRGRRITWDQLTKVGKVEV